MKDYHINVFHSEEDDGYIADIPDLKYCSACGDTPERLCDRCKSPKKPGFRPEKKSRKNIPEPNKDKIR